MTDKHRYLTAVRDIIGDARRSPFGLNLLTNSPGKRVDDDFEVKRDVGGVITIFVAEDLYRELEEDLDPFMRKVLESDRSNGRVTIRFHHT